jgi:hypothetical protein
MRNRHSYLVFDEKWEILEPDNESIYVEKRNGVYHYIAPVDSVTIAEMFKTLDTTIDYNMDLQRKLLLFKKKTEELQEIFANESLEVLETIEFKYGLKKKEQAKKKRGKKSKKDEKGIKQKLTQIMPSYLERASELQAICENIRIH